MEKAKKQKLSLDDPKTFLRILSQNWWLLVIVPVAVYSLALVYLHRTQEVYAARMQVILKSGEVYDYQSNLLKGLGMSNSFRSYDQIESQKKVIRSTNMVAEVLERLNLDVSYFIEGRLKTTEYFKSTPFEVRSSTFGPNAYGRDFYLNIINLVLFKIF